MSFRNSVKKYAETPITRQLVLEVLDGYENINDKITQLIKSNELIALRRGLYILGPQLDLPAPTPFLIANHLRGPSYVSLESALSHWDMIPEKVFEISSVTIKTSKVYQNTTGRYSYKQLRTPYYSYGIKNMMFSSKQTILIATPEKALCDKIVLTPKVYLRSMTQTRAFLLDDLRIDREDLRKLDTVMMKQWLEMAPKKSSLVMLIKTLKTL